MLVLSLISVGIGFILLIYGNGLNVFAPFEGQTSPGETLVIIGSVCIAVGIISLLIMIFQSKSQSVQLNILLSLDLLVPAFILVIGIICAVIASKSYDDAWSLTTQLDLEGAEQKLHLGRALNIWGIVLNGIGGLVLIFNILKRMFSTEKALSIYITAAAGLSSVFLFTKPLYGVLIPDLSSINHNFDKSIANTVGFDIKVFSVMPESENFDISASGINLWCALCFILLFTALGITILSQFISMPKISLISSVVCLGTLILMFLGLMVIYTVFSDHMGVAHSFKLYIEYTYCLLLSGFIFIANIIKINITEGNS